jgi:GNAT superfamily N-acetyltransferase
MDVEIRQILQPDEDLTETMTDWMYSWWGETEGYPREAVRLYVQNSCQPRLPCTFGLFADGRLRGMYQLRLEDLFVRPDLYPWLANVYLEPSARGLGLGGRMLSSVRDHARQLTGFPQLYLYTAHQGLYEKYGWVLAGEIDTCLPQRRIQRLYRLSLTE